MVPPHHILDGGQNHHHNGPPLPSGVWMPSKVMWPSHDDCTTTCHPGHLVGRPPSWQTWDLRVPTLFLSNLFPSYCMLMLLYCSTVVVHISALIPNSETNCMCPCALFASPSPSPPCRQPPYIQILSGPCPDIPHVPATL